MASEIEAVIDSLDVADEVKRRAKALIRLTAHRVTWDFAESARLNVDLYGSDGAACIRSGHALLGNVTAGAILDSPYLQALEELAEASLKAHAIENATVPAQFGGPEMDYMQEAEAEARTRREQALDRLRALKGTG